MSGRAAEALSIDPHADLDLRLVRYFTVVAEHLNFGRAATELHVAQPALSRQIQRLERQLAVPLFVRTPHGSHLTEAGLAFLPQARDLLSSARRAMRSAHAASAPNVITIGFVEDLVITPAIRDLRRRHPDADIRTRHLKWTEALHDLREHRVDAVVARMPFPSPSDGLSVTVLYDEPRILAIAAVHRLAEKMSVGLEDFADEPLIPCPASAPTLSATWNEFWRLEPRVNGCPAPLGPVAAHGFEDKLELIADGRAVAILPASDRRVTLRHDVVTIPIEGIDPCKVVVATRVDECQDLVEGFVECAQVHLGPAR